MWRSGRLCRGQGDCWKVMNTVGWSGRLLGGQGDCVEVTEAVKRSERL